MSWTKHAKHTLDLLAACAADFDGKGSVGVSDLLDLLANWGLCP